MKISRALASIVVLIVLSGCVTTMQDRRKAQSREEMEMQNLRRTVQRLEEKVAGLSESQQQVYSEMESVRAQSVREHGKVESRLTAIDNSLKQAGAARTQLRKDIVAELSAKMATIIRSHVPAGGSQRGREHIVQRGETVSEIAGAYGVTASAIIKANKLNSSAVIRVGQKLFIPE